MFHGSLDRRSLHASYRASADANAAARAVIAASLERLRRLDDPGIFLHLRPEADLAADIAALPPFDPEAHPLWGLPFAVKDNIDIAGLPTTAACPEFAYVARKTAPVVKRLLKAGAIMIGKTNLDQFATGLVGVRTPYPVPRNAFDAARVPGGSSSGSAVAVAQGLVSFALGTDTAGSGRIPAAFNNLVGLKPTLGALSTRGVVPACRTLDCVSIFALGVDDARAVFDAAVAYDIKEPYSRRVRQSRRECLRIGVPRPQDLCFFGDAMAEAAWRAVLDRLAADGVKPVETPIAHLLETAELLYAGPWVAERRAAVGAFMDKRPEALHPVTKAILAGAGRFTAVDGFNAFYRLAALRRQADATFRKIDALAVPTAPVFPTLADLAADTLGPNTRLGTYTNFVNLLDLAAIAAPGPLRGDGLPAGVTFIGPAGTDHALSRLAGRFFPGLGGGPALLAQGV